VQENRTYREETIALRERSTTTRYDQQRQVGGASLTCLSGVGLLFTAAHCQSTDAVAAGRRTIEKKTRKHNRSARVLLCICPLAIQVFVSLVARFCCILSTASCSQCCRPNASRIGLTHPMPGASTAVCRLQLTRARTNGRTARTPNIRLTKQRTTEFVGWLVTVFLTSVSRLSVCRRKSYICN
jgi:hypothetical protein